MRRKNVRIKKELQNGIQKGIVVSVLAAITVVALSFSIPQEAQVRAACIPPTPGCFNEDLVPDAPNVRNIGQTFPDLDWKSLYLSGFTYLGPLTSDPSDWQFCSLYYNITSNSFRFTDNGGVWKSTGINSITTLGDLIAGNDSGEFSQFAAGTESQILKTNGTGEDPYWTTLPSGQGGGLYSFGGDGDDGDYNPTGANVTIPTDGKEVVVKNYDSFDLDEGQTLRLLGTIHDNGVLLVIRVKGNANIDGQINLTGYGGKGGSGGVGAGNGADGKASNLYFDNLNHFGTKAGNASNGAGGATVEIPFFYISHESQTNPAATGLYRRPWGIVPGSGGGGGYGIGCTGGTGGRGGGSIILEVKGNLHFDGSIVSDGGVGGNGAAGCDSSGGGGGASGTIFIIYNTANGSGGSNTSRCPDVPGQTRTNGGLCIAGGGGGVGSKTTSATIYGPGGGANLSFGLGGNCTGGSGDDSYDGFLYIEPGQGFSTNTYMSTITNSKGVSCADGDDHGGGWGALGGIVVVKNRWLGINP